MSSKIRNTSVTGTV